MSKKNSKPELVVENDEVSKGRVSMDIPLTTSPALNAILFADDDEEEEELHDEQHQHREELRNSDIIALEEGNGGQGLGQRKVTTRTDDEFSGLIEKEGVNVDEKAKKKQKEESKGVQPTKKKAMRIDVEHAKQVIALDRTSVRWLREGTYSEELPPDLAELVRTLKKRKKKKAKEIDLK
jgi:hypothetical protein